MASDGARGDKPKDTETNLMAPRFPGRFGANTKKTPETNLRICGVRERKTKNTGNELDDGGNRAPTNERPSAHPTSDVKS